MRLHCVRQCQQQRERPADRLCLRATALEPISAFWNVMNVPMDVLRAITPSAGARADDASRVPLSAGLPQRPRALGVQRRKRAPHDSDNACVCVNSS